MTKFLDLEWGKDEFAEYVPGCIYEILFKI